METLVPRLIVDWLLPVALSYILLYILGALIMLEIASLIDWFDANQIWYKKEWHLVLVPFLGGILLAALEVILALLILGLGFFRYLPRILFQKNLDHRLRRLFILFCVDSSRCLWPGVVNRRWQSFTTIRKFCHLPIYLRMIFDGVPDWYAL